MTAQQGVLPVGSVPDGAVEGREAELQMTLFQALLLPDPRHLFRGIEYLTVISFM
jgi:hypothetical protein